jgi:hypothetical protein
MENEALPKDEFTSKKLVYEYYFHESERISTRTDWFLIFHAILLEAFFAIKDPDTGKVIVVGAVGILSAYIWWVNGLRAFRISWQLGNLLSNENIMGELSKMNEQIFKERRESIDKKWYGWAKHTPLYTVVTPCLFVLAWETLLFFTLESNFSKISQIAIVCYLIIGTILSMLIIAYVTRKINTTFKKDSNPIS